MLSPSHTPQPDHGGRAYRPQQCCTGKNEHKPYSSTTMKRKKREQKEKRRGESITGN
jgi:hypothetical protein